MSVTKKAGRPKSGRPLRSTQVHFYLTEQDATYFDRYAEKMGFRTRSAMFTAIAERLSMGGMSGLAFVKTGWQFANLPAMKANKDGYFWGMEPFPPLLEDLHEDPATDQKLVSFIEGIKKEAQAAAANQGKAA